MASYYEPQGWQVPTARQGSWEQPAPPSRSGSSSVSAQREDTPAFSSQFDEIDRAVDNLVKSGKLWNNPRRDSMPMAMGRPYPDYDPRMMTAMAQRHHSMSDFDGPRMHPAANLQGFYASQRYQGRPNDVEQAMQAKRRMAAQRERELRNYHQEQQYNRSLLAEMSGTKSDRSVSPAAMSEDGRRELLARQHRALYGNESPAFFTPGSLGDEHARTDGVPGPSNGTPSSTSGVRGASPRGGVIPVSSVSASVSASTSVAGTLQSPNRANSTSSPNPGAYGTDQPTATSTSSPVAGPGVAPGPGTGNGGSDSPSSARQPASSASSMQPGSVGPIGSRPIPQTASGQAANPALNKRSTTPLPSPLGYGFSSSSSNNNESTTEQRSTSSASNPVVAGSTVNGNGATKDTTSSAVGGVGGVVGGVGVGLGGWGNGSGVWGSKNGLGVQASVWG